MPKWSTSALNDPKKYRFGFNGKEDDDEWAKQDYGFRIYDGRIGRFLSVDPIASKYPWYTPYQFAGNMPIWASDLDGLEPDFKGSNDKQYEIAKQKGSEDYYGWSWNVSKSDWSQGDLTQYSDGNAMLNSPDDDLTKEHYSSQKVNAICTDSENCHYQTLTSAIAAGISLENDKAKGEAGILFQRFEHGYGENYSFGLQTEMSRILSEDAGFVKYARNFEVSAKEYFKMHGTLDGFLGLTEDRPYIKDTWFMHTVMGGNQQIDAQIQSISATEIIVQYKVWDHFGAGRNDASSNLPGLPSMYWLQHNSWLAKPHLRQKYVPFIWNIEVKR